MKHTFRFFAVPGPDGLVHLEADDARHLARVLRLRAGAEVEVGDGSGRVYSATVEDPRSGLLRLGDPIDVEGVLAPVQILLAQSGPRADDAVEKLVELGVAEIGPLETSARRHAPRRDRWERIARSAAAQAKLTRIPTILDPRPFADALLDTPIICSHERDQVDIATALRAAPARPLVVLVGPEAGFAERELDAAVAAGCPIARLGPTVLRSETAAIVAATHAVAFARADTLQP